MIFNDALYAISLSRPSSYDASGYSDPGMIYTDISKVESFPEFGLEQAVSEFTPVSGHIEYVKGGPRYGQGPMIVGDLPGDAGQQMLATAANSRHRCSLRIWYADGEVHYLEVLVASWKLLQSAEGQIMKRSALVGLCQRPVISHIPHPTMFGTLVTAEDQEHSIGNTLILADGLGVSLAANLALADGSFHPIFGA